VPSEGRLRETTTTPASFGVSRKSNVSLPLSGGCHNPRPSRFATRIRPADFSSWPRFTSLVRRPPAAYVAARFAARSRALLEVSAPIRRRLRTVRPCPVDLSRPARRGEPTKPSVDRSACAPRRVRRPSSSRWTAPRNGACVRTPSSSPLATEPPFAPRRSASAIERRRPAKAPKLVERPTFGPTRELVPRSTISSVFGRLDGAPAERGCAST